MDEHAQKQDPVAPGMCPTGCGRVQPHGKLMCLTCWREVPDHLKADVMRTWRAYRRLVDSRLPVTADSRAQRDRIRARGDHRVAYEAARDAAIGSIR